MKINITKLTDVELAREACSYTLHSGNATTIGLKSLYECEHSPARTQLFQICMDGIPSAASVHFVRHATVGQQHFVQTMRDDRGAKFVADRNTPVRHMMIVNAQHLIDMSRRRLCTSAATETRAVMGYIRDIIKTIDPDLYDFLVPNCIYRNKCTEPKGCGYFHHYQKGTLENG